MSADISSVYTIIPTGGEGKRLRPYTYHRSKPMVPVVNTFPIIELVLYSLTYGAGLRNFIFGARGVQHYTNLQNYFQGGSGWSAKLGIVPQAHLEYQNPNYYDTGTADSAHYNIKDYAIESPIIVCQSDNLFWGEDIKELYDQALASPYDFTVGLTQVPDASQLGVAELDPKSNRITAFLEKPGSLYSHGGLVSTGIYIIKPAVFPLLLGDFGKDVIPRLTAQGRVGGYIFAHPWYDFGNPQIHLASTLALLRSPTPCFASFLTRICHGYRYKGSQIWLRGKSSFALDYAAKTLEKLTSGRIGLEGTVFIGKNTVIEEGVYLKDCAIGDYSSIGSGSRIVASNILDAWKIGSNCTINGSFLGRGGMMENGSVAYEQFLGDNSVIQNLGGAN